MTSDTLKNIAQYHDLKNSIWENLLNGETKVIEEELPARNITANEGSFPTISNVDKPSNSGNFDNQSNLANPDISSKSGNYSNSGSQGSPIYDDNYKASLANTGANIAIITLLGALSFSLGSIVLRKRRYKKLNRYNK